MYAVSNLVLGSIGEAVNKTDRNLCLRGADSRVQELETAYEKS